MLRRGSGFKSARPEADLQRRMEQSSPLAHPDLKRRAAPFVAAGCLAFLLVPLPPRGENPVALLAAATLTFLIIAASVLIPWARLPSWAQALPPLAYLLAVGLLRHAEGGATSGYGTLGLLPILWLALYGSRGQLALALVFMFTMLAAPIVIFGEPFYPASEWRRALVWAGVGPVIGFSVQRLVREIEQLLARLYEVARSDALTQVANRRAWDEQLPRELARAKRSSEPLSVAIIDLDHFKAFNDDRGHQAGDELLKAVASAWANLVREGDFFARYGGEEFAVLLPACPAAEVREITERLRRAVPEDQTCSVGVATWDGSEPEEELVRRADDALYEAKRTGRDRAVIAA
jgi:diguanylate cyclase (GGDEF)-like protein